ncbi:hypothetical protein Pan216_20300 [Planctomycetes bacterium Pan216]|uniref:Methyltransferase domain-containing protein n=1 Tax=Kolteria novifilia TaxID=2527975 RepID=A0A518B2L9_9BACT|nr:hypothetical protein Pan216_20300 [Planctomycetes bacterium Pan216]
MLFPDLSARHLEPEIMDQAELDRGAHRQALKGLARLNAVTSSARILWGPLRRFCESRRGSTTRVLDIACGGADVTVRLATWARRRGFTLEVAGCDRSPVALEEARANAARADVAMELFPFDLDHDPIPSGYDVLTASLFLHHLDEERSIALLRNLAGAAGHLVLVHDLVRGPLGYALAYTGCHFLTSSYVVRTDGPLSVRAAYTVKEVERLAQAAGMDGCHVHRRWLQRLLLTWMRP